MAFSNLEWNLLELKAKVAGCWLSGQSHDRWCNLRERNNQEALFPWAEQSKKSFKRGIPYFYQFWKKGGIWADTRLKGNATQAQQERK